MDLKQLILIRHGELPPEYAGRFVGSTDAPLGEKGMEDCRALAGIWKEMNSEVTFVSPKLRARQTAELVCGDGEIQLDDRLREVDFGRWETLNFEEIAGRDPEYSKYWYDHPQEIHFPEGESVPKAQLVDGLHQRRCDVRLFAVDFVRVGCRRLV